MKIRSVLFLGLLIILTGCAKQEIQDANTESEALTEETVITEENLTEIYTESVEIEEVEIAQETKVLEEVAPAVPILLETVASGTLEKRDGRAVIDYSNTADGYIMVQHFGETSQRLKVQVKGNHTTYTYNLPQGDWSVFPLSDGNGTYQVTIYENIGGNQYAMVLAESFEVVLHDEFAPFIRPNQYVDYSNATQTIEKAAELVTGIEDPIQKVEAVYDYVVGNVTYDKEKAASVQSGYLPDLDEVMESKKGICFDYAALMTGMLRSQGIPCKLVVGYAGSAYHAWINVWTEENGWVDGIIYFDSQTWHRMDPTFASSSGQSDEIMDYIGDGSNYTEKYLY